MKKLILLFFILLIAGCNYPMGGNIKGEELKVSFDKIIFAKDIDLGKGKVKKYYWTGDNVATGTLKIKGKEVKEDVSRRTTKEQFFTEGVTTTVKMYLTDERIKIGAVWKELEDATTTIGNFENKTKKLGKSERLEMLGGSGDPMFTGAGDGSIVYDGNVSWATCQTAGTGTTAYSTVNAINIVSVYKLNSGTGQCQIYRGFFPVKLASIGAGNTISAGVLYMSIYGTYDGDNDANGVSTLFESTQAASSTLATADYDAFNSTALSNNVDTTGISLESNPPTDPVAYTAYTLNAAGVTLANTHIADTLMIGVREGHDYNNDVPTYDTDNGTVGFMSEYTGTNADPYWVFTYAPSTPPETSTIFYEPIINIIQ